MSLQLALAIALIGLSSVAFAQPLVIDASTQPSSAASNDFHMGTSRDPDGHEIGVNSVNLLHDGKPWLPVMGEFQYSRYPAAAWRDELLKMKAGGVDIVATYVFWIHHEEIEGQWDWTDRRNLRGFVQACKEVGLPVVLRIGPWDHGEVRQGGFPDWLVAKGWKLRSDDERYMSQVRELYQQIAQQVQGLLWKDGGPVVGVQVENEFGGAGEHLMHLKTLAREVGLDVPIYTRTGWPNLRSPVPFGEILPLFGAYAEGFWDRDLKSMPGRYWQAFLFRDQRTDNAVATDQLGARQSKDELDAQVYPYLTCELGGGMMSSYHRRIKIEPMDVLAVAMCKIGSGSNLPGYYVYHGGTNPDSKTGVTLQEAQATPFTNYNDMPVKNYDFQAPLGEFGQVRPQYHLLRRLHLFLHDWGSELAGMRPIMPKSQPASGRDAETLRWCARTNGSAGFIFVNNYQRSLPMAAKSNVQFEIKLAQGSIRVPDGPVTIPADTCFVWPFNLDLGGARLIYATAQPVCRVEDGDKLYVIFAQTPGVSASFVFADGLGRFDDVKPGKGIAVQVAAKDGKSVCIVLLDEQNSLACWKGSVNGRDRVLLSSANLVLDGNRLRVRSSDSKALNVGILPADSGEPDGVFRRINANSVSADALVATCEPIKQAGAVREFKKGSRGVAEAPTDGDFEQAAVWRVKLPKQIDSKRQLRLRIHYRGNVARIYLDGKLIADDFYNGNPMELGLNRFAPDSYEKELALKILPLQKDAPIYLAKDAWPDFKDANSVAAVESIEMIEEHEAVITP